MGYTVQDFMKEFKRSYFQFPLWDTIYLEQEVNVHATLCFQFPLWDTEGDKNKVG